MARTLYLMRHGETLFNVQRRVQGASDSPLTERGIEQGRAAGVRLRERGVFPDSFVSSSSERACDTVELVSRELYGEVRPYQRLKGIKEFNRGIFEGEPLYLMPRDRELRNKYFVPYGGESDDDALARMEETLVRVMEEAGGESVLAVSHGGVGGLFMRKWAGEDVLGMWPMPNCTVMVYDFHPATEAEPASFSFREAILPEEEWR